jgi:hypothetical protein
MRKSMPSAKEASWLRIVDEYASSGRSAKEFCQLKAILLRMFYCWRRKIGDRRGQTTSFCDRRARGHVIHLGTRSIWLSRRIIGATI